VIKDVTNEQMMDDKKLNSMFRLIVDRLN